MIHFALWGETWQCCICRSTLLCFYQERLGPSLLLSFVVSLKFIYAFSQRNHLRSGVHFIKEDTNLDCLLVYLTHVMLSARCSRAGQRNTSTVPETYLHEKLLSCPTGLTTGTLWWHKPNKNKTGGCLLRASECCAENTHRLRKQLPLSQLQSGCTNITNNTRMIHTEADFLVSWKQK